MPAASGRPAGAVLAGGASSRFGAEKAMALIGHRPLLAWSLAALDAACAPVGVVAKAGTGAWALAQEHGRPCLQDDPAYPPGPLTGVAVALTWASENGADLLVTAPTDTPLFGALEIEALLQAIGPHPAAFAATASGAQGLCAVWRVDRRARLLDRLAAGQHPSVHGWLAEIEAAHVLFQDAPFRNINTRADLEALEASLRRRARPTTDLS